MREEYDEFEWEPVVQAPAGVVRQPQLTDHSGETLNAEFKSLKRNCHQPNNLSLIHI